MNLILAAVLSLAPGQCERCGPNCPCKPACPCCDKATAGLLLLAPVQTDEYAEAEARAAAALAIARSTGPMTTTYRPTTYAADSGVGSPRGYATAKMHALMTHTPLVVFVKCEERPVQNATSYRWDDYGTIDPDVRGPAIVVGLPQRDDVYRAAVLPAESPDSAIAAWVTSYRGTQPGVGLATTPAAPVYSAPAASYQPVVTYPQAYAQQSYAVGGYQVSCSGGS